MKKQLVFLFTMAFLLSCAKEEFAANKSQNTSSFASAIEYEQKMCGQHSLIKPKVDILIMWDNSGSILMPDAPGSISSMKTTYLNAVKTLVKDISDNRFNFRILNVPLIGSQRPILLKSPLSDDNGSDTFSYPLVDVYDDPATINNGVNAISFNDSAEHFEAGIEDSINVINSKYKNIFRRNVNTFIIVISNGDDQKCDNMLNYNCPPTDLEEYLEKQKERLLCLKGNSTYYSTSKCAASPLNITKRLDANMLRFISLVPTNSGCEGFSYSRGTYSKISRSILHSNKNILAPSNGDTYNLCDKDINTKKFNDEVLSSLKSVLSFYKYQYWPIAQTGKNLDKTSLRVYRNGSLLQDNTYGPPGLNSGYRRHNNLNDVTNLETRLAPETGEKYSGKFIELLGNDRELLGNCLSTYYTDEKQTAKFIYLKAGKPSLDKMSVKRIINGQVENIPQLSNSQPNGWSYINPISIKALSDNNPSYAIVDRPANENIIGHFIELHGVYVTPNTSSITYQVDYIPASN